MKYTISFKNGHKINIDVTDGDKFTKELFQGAKDSPQAQQQYYAEPGFIINVSDITACHPKGMEC